MDKTIYGLTNDTFFSSLLWFLLDRTPEKLLSSIYEMIGGEREAFAHL